jgi:hypothetical protein
MTVGEAESSLTVTISKLMRRLRDCWTAEPHMGSTRC